MKYTAINELDQFQFHDARIEEIIFDDDTMIWKVISINAMTTNSQNDHPRDMRIRHAVMTFENVSVEKLVFGPMTTYNADGMITEKKHAAEAKPEEHCNILRTTESHNFEINHMSDFLRVDDEKFHCVFGILDDSDYFDLTFTFSKSTIEWDAYGGIAWYERPRNS